MKSLKKAAEELKSKILASPLEKNLQEATSNENWSAPTKCLNEIADHSFN